MKEIFKRKKVIILIASLLLICLLSVCVVVYLSLIKDSGHDEAEGAQGKKQLESVQFSEFQNEAENFKKYLIENDSTIESKEVEKGVVSYPAFLNSYTGDNSFPATLDGFILMLENEEFPEEMSADVTQLENDLRELRALLGKIDTQTEYFQNVYAAMGY